MVPNIALQFLEGGLLVAIGFILPILLKGERIILSKIKQSTSLRVIMDIAIGVALVIGVFLISYWCNNGKISLYHILLPLFGYWLQKSVIKLIKRIKIAITARKTKKII